MIRGSINPYSAHARQYNTVDVCTEPYACCENLLIENNYIHDLVNGTLSDKAFIQLWGAGGSVERATRTLIRRNTFHDLYTSVDGSSVFLAQLSAVKIQTRFVLTWQQTCAKLQVQSVRPQCHQQLLVEPFGTGYALTF